MNRYDDRDPRSPRYRDDRRGSYGFEEAEYSGRTAGDDDQQPYSRNPYGYHPGQRDRGERERSGSRYSESQYGQQRRRPVYGSDVDARYGEGRGFGEGPFSNQYEDPGYFGMGYYADGGASPTGGFDQRTRERNYGSLGEDTFTSDRSRDRGWGWDEHRHSERRFRTGPKGYTRSDERLREDISERLMMANSIDSSDVSVTVKDGKVSLEGSVPNRRMKHSIEDLVDAAPGVQDIDNRIRVRREETR